VTAGDLGVALAYTGVAVAAVLAGDWLTLLVAWELMAVTATVLSFAKVGYYAFVRAAPSASTPGPPPGR
jgi:formate hydrogenlyase subunit 3/multisubunit Na+/H+ antiporter MnhD subunit